MKCKKCKRIIEDNSIYCNWCGHKQLTASDDVRVPVPVRRGDTWSAQVMVKGERAYVTADSEEEYYAIARATKASLIENKKAAPKLTLGTAIDNYVKDHGNLISPSTLNSYKSYRKTRFQDYMDDEVSEIKWQQMVNAEAKHFSPKTVINAWSLVRLSLKYAGIAIPQIKLPRKRKTKKNWLDFQQIQTFTLALRGKPYELGALLALNGLRRSEILYLSACDIDESEKTINIHGARVLGDGGKMIDKEYNKTSASTRCVHIVIPRILELTKDTQGRLVKTNPTTLYGSINGLCKSKGLPEVGVHGLRHSFASLAYHLKWSELTTMREGGWDDPQVVHNIYTHLASQDANEDIKRMEKFFTTDLLQETKK